MKRPWLWISVGTALHSFAGMAAFLWHYRISSDHFGGYPVSHAAAFLARALTSITWFPVAEPLMRTYSWLGWLAILANSVLCGTMVAMVWSVFARIRRPQRLPRESAPPETH